MIIARLANDILIVTSVVIKLTIISILISAITSDMVLSLGRVLPSVGVALVPLPDTY